MFLCIFLLTQYKLLLLLFICYILFMVFLHTHTHIYDIIFSFYNIVALENKKKTQTVLYESPVRIKCIHHPICKNETYVVISILWDAFEDFSKEAESDVCSGSLRRPQFCLIFINKATLKWKYTDVMLHLYWQEVTEIHSRFQTDLLHSTWTKYRQCFLEYSN